MLGQQSSKNSALHPPSDIIAIVGPTATGKTSLGLKLASMVMSGNREMSWKGVFMISVDSRQVYSGLEICSGVDLPGEWEKADFFGNFGFKNPSLPIFSFGTSMISPDQEWSVAHFRKFALPLIKTAFSEGFLVVLVGGTGLYHEQLFSSDPHIDVPPNPKIRDQAQLLQLSELQEWVKNEAPEQWMAMNASDSANPRRLIRLLEKGLIDQSMILEDQIGSHIDGLLIDKIRYSVIGITSPINLISTKIRLRVEQRLQSGAIAEVQALISKYGSAKDLPAFSATGCREIQLFLEEKVSFPELVELWTKREVQYAKRQLTWWKSHQNVVTTADFLEQKVEWHTLDEQSGDGAWQTAAIASCILGL